MMVYADTDLFLALLKQETEIGKAAKRLLKKYEGRIWTSPVTLIELLLVAAEYGSAYGRRRLWQEAEGVEIGRTLQ